MKLAFLQRVKEVTTDGADGADRYSTLIHDILCLTEAQLGGCSCLMKNIIGVSRI